MLTALLALILVTVPKNHSKIVVEGFTYDVIYSSHTLGVTNYPINDKHDREIVLPIDPDQRPISFLHELMHACMHNHPHHYHSVEALQRHLDTTVYTEEVFVTQLTSCIQEYEATYGTAGIREAGRSGKKESGVGAVVSKRSKEHNSSDGYKGP